MKLRIAVPSVNRRYGGIALCARSACSVLLRKVDWKEMIMPTRKKTWKIVLFSLLGLVVAAYLFLFFSFNGYKPAKVEHEIVPEALGYFHETYEDCRLAFRESANRLVVQYEGVDVFMIPVAGKTDPDLTIDCCYIPAQATTENLLILSSGVHGIEGFLGSAVQLMVMEEVLSPAHLKTTGIFFIHGMNPYGFKHLRRVTENNVDLNRNCAIDERLFDTENEGYRKLQGMLNPRGKANHRSLKNKHMHLVLLQKVLAESMLVVRQAVLQGQYDNPEGIIFGGQEVEPQIIAISPILKDKLKPYARILTIDLHTAWGRNGTMHLFSRPIEDVKIKTGMEALFAGYRIDWGDSKDFYTIGGGFADYVGALVSGKTYYPMPFEFGTFDSQKTFGSLRSLHYMILENQGFHYGYEDEKTEARIKKDFRELFFPSDEAWRLKAIMDAKRILELVLERLGTSS